MRESVLRMVVVVTEVTTAMSEEWGVRESVLRMVARASKLVSGKVKYEDYVHHEHQLEAGTFHDAVRPPPRGTAAHDLPRRCSHHCCPI